MDWVMDVYNLGDPKELRMDVLEDSIIKIYTDDKNTGALYSEY